MGSEGHESQRQRYKRILAMLGTTRAQLNERCPENIEDTLSPESKQVWRDLMGGLDLEHEVERLRAELDRTHKCALRKAYDRVEVMHELQERCEATDRAVNDLLAVKAYVRKYAQSPRWQLDAECALGLIANVIGVELGKKKESE